MCSNYSSESANSCYHHLSIEQSMVVIVLFLVNLKHNTVVFTLHYVNVLQQVMMAHIYTMFVVKYKTY